MKHKKFWRAVAVGLVCTIASLLFVRVETGAGYSSSLVGVAVPIVDKSAYGDLDNRTNTEQQLGASALGRSCPAVEANITSKLYGFPLAATGYESGTGKGCAGSVDRWMIYVIGIIINIAVYASIFGVVNSRLIHRANK